MYITYARSGQTFLVQDYLQQLCSVSIQIDYIFGEHRSVHISFINRCIYIKTIKIHGLIQAYPTRTGMAS